MITASFSYRYDPTDGLLKVLNDASSYTVSELSWELHEKINIYDFEITDKYNMKITQDPITGENKTDKVEIPKALKVLFDFDISRAGQYKGMENIDEILEKTYSSLGMKKKNTAARTRDSGLDFIEK